MQIYFMQVIAWSCNMLFPSFSWVVFEWYTYLQINTKREPPNPYVVTVHDHIPIKVRVI
jgi:hypothetical protein